MRADHQMLISNSKPIMIGNSLIGIKLEATSEYLLFSQKTQQFNSYLDFENFEPATIVDEDTQYFYAQKKRNKKQLKTYLIKFRGDEIQQQAIKYETIPQNQENPNQLRDLNQFFDELCQLLLNYFCEPFAQKSNKNSNLNDDSFDDDQSYDSQEEKEQSDGLILSHVKDVKKNADEVAGNFRKLFCGLDQRVETLLSQNNNKNLKDFELIDCIRALDITKIAVSLEKVTFFHGLRRIVNNQEQKNENTFNWCKLQSQEKFQDCKIEIVVFDFNTEIKRQQWKDVKFSYTKNYLVIISLQNVYWMEKTIFSDKQETDKQPEFTQSKFQKLPFKEFDKNLTEDGFSVVVASKFNVETAEEAEVRDDVIQVSFKNLAILWDLKENKEVVFIERVDQFKDYNHFTHTGFLPHIFNIGSENKIMKNALMMVQNEQGTLMMNQPSKHNLTGIFFRNFSMLDMYEVLHVKNCIEKEVYVPNIDLYSALANFNGQTFFQTVMDNPDYYNIIENQIKVQDLLTSRNVDKDGKKSDNFIIRQLYWTLLQPVYQSYNKYSSLGEFEQQLQKEILKKAFSHQSFDKLMGRKKDQNFNQKKYRKLVYNLPQYVLEDGSKQHLLDPLLRLLLLSEEIRLSDLMVNITQFGKAFDTNSNIVREFLEKSMFETEITKDIESLIWYQDIDQITFASNSSMLSKDKLQEQIRLKFQEQEENWFLRLRKFLNEQFFGTKFEQKVTLVNIKILEVEWLGSKRDLEVFYKDLSSRKQDIFTNSLIKTILSNQKMGIRMYLIFDVFLVFFITSIVYFFHYLFAETEAQGYTSGEAGKLRIIINVSSLILLWVESSSFLKVDGFRLNQTNVCTAIAVIMTNYIVIAHGAYFDQDQIHNLAIIASVTMVVQWWLLIFWIRLFEGLSFYVILIQQTIIDIAYFLIMFFICICMFATAIYILNRLGVYKDNLHTDISLNQNTTLTEFNFTTRLLQNSTLYNNESVPALTQSQTIEPEKHDPLFGVATGNGIIDSLLNQYRVGLGDFHTDSYGNTSKVIWIYYIMSTAFTQILFFNMLVAIMAETFAKVKASRQQQMLKAQANIHANYIKFKSSKLMQDRYMYVVTTKSSTENESDEQQLLNSILATKQKVGDNLRKVEEIGDQSITIKIDVDDLQKQLNEAQEKFSEQQQLLEACFMHIRELEKKLNEQKNQKQQKKQ